MVAHKKWKIHALRSFGNDYGLKIHVRPVAADDKVGTGRNLFLFLFHYTSCNITQQHMKTN